MGFSSKLVHPRKKARRSFRLRVARQVARRVAVTSAARSAFKLSSVSPSWLSSSLSSFPYLDRNTVDTRTVFLSSDTVVSESLSTHAAFKCSRFFLSFIILFFLLYLFF